jgi:hypothetical protein
MLLLDNALPHLGVRFVDGWQNGHELHVHLIGTASARGHAEVVDNSATSHRLGDNLAIVIAAGRGAGVRRQPVIADDQVAEMVCGNVLCHLIVNAPQTSARSGEEGTTSEDARSPDRPAAT